MRTASSNSMEFLLALRFQDEERKFCRLKADEKGNFYALGLAEPLPKLDRHASYHASGIRHFRTKGKSINKSKKLKCREPKLQPTSRLRGVEQLLKSGVDRGVFQRLPILRHSSGRVILLDADAAGFTDDWFGINVYLVEENQEGQIPLPPRVGPRVVQIERRTKPWLAVEAFQEQVRGE